MKNGYENLFQTYDRLLKDKDIQKGIVLSLFLCSIIVIPLFLGVHFDNIVLKYIAIFDLFAIMFGALIFFGYMNNRKSLD